MPLRGPEGWAWVTFILAIRRPPHPWPEQLGLRVEGGAVCWFGCWKFNSHLDDDDEEPEDEDQEIRDKTLPRWQIWLAAERSRDHRHWQPWRPDKARKQTEEDCEDPERQVSHHAHPRRRALLSPVPAGFPFPGPRAGEADLPRSGLQKRPLPGKRQGCAGCW